MQQFSPEVTFFFDYSMEIVKEILCDIVESAMQEVGTIL